MTYDDDDDQEGVVGVVAPDTPLPKDLLEHLVHLTAKKGRK